MSPLHGVLRPFSDIFHTIDVIQVAPDCVCDPPRRLVECKFGLKTALFHLKYQVNWVHKKGFFPSLSYKVQSPAKNSKVTSSNVEGCWLRLAFLMKKNSMETTLQTPIFH